MGHTRELEGLRFFGQIARDAVERSGDIGVAHLEFRDGIAGHEVRFPLRHVADAGHVRQRLFIAPLDHVIRQQEAHRSRECGIRSVARRHKFRYGGTAQAASRTRCS